MPNVFGVNFIPAEDRNAREMFKKIERNEDNLRLAYAALNEENFLAREKMMENKINKNLQIF